MPLSQITAFQSILYGELAQAMPSSKALGRDAKSKKQSAPSKKASKSAPPPSFKSSEYIQESDEEEPENFEKDNKSDSDDESLPSSPADVMIPPNGKLPRSAGSSSSSENESESDESGSEADDEDEEEGEPNVAAEEIIETPDKKSTKHAESTVVRSKNPPPYKPPVGFEKASLDGTPKAGHMFKKSSVEGKQIWYLTAPASLPVSSIVQMSLRDAINGKPIINHKGNDYGFMRDSAEDKTYTKIMVPNGSVDGYRTTKNSINQIFHLQQIVQLPDVHASSSIIASSSSSKATIPARKPIRQQPQGLKMRFRPIGFGDGETGKIGSSSSSIDSSSISDEEMEGQPAPFRRPVSVASESSDGDGSEGEGSSESSESGEEPSSPDVEMVEAPPLPTKPSAKERTDKASTKVSSLQEMTNGSLKRKYGDREEGKSKHSSSRSSSNEERELKRLKKKQTEPQRGLGDRVSVSIEHQKSSMQRSSAKSEITSSKKDSSIGPPKPAILPHSSPTPWVLVGPERKDDDQISPVKPKPKKRDRSEPATPLRKSGVSLHDLTKATDPSLTGEERRKKVKKLKNKD